jgi:hypothetical protein
MQCGNQPVHFGARVVERERCSGGSGEAETLHCRHRTVVAGADGDALVIEDRANVVRMCSAASVNDRMLALLRAVPMILSPTMSATRAVA